MESHDVLNGVVEQVKSAGLKVYTAAISPVRARGLARRSAQRLSVLCYHRVNDLLRDNVSLPARQFDQQMEFIRSRYQIVSVADIVAERLDRSSARPIVAVTFDDGYRDNYENAAPILAKHKIPATFFISTGMIGTDVGFRHDHDQLGFSVPTLNWDQVQEMSSYGFEIGAHTVHHVNLAKVDEATAREELVLSRDAIRQRTGAAGVPFAYCFGGRNDITQDRLQLVKNLGFTCCFSTFGGTNEGPIDLFGIKRFGVNSAISTLALQARIEGSYG